MKGKVIVLTGDGKGKTTSAFGCALRAAGHGKRVVVIQFMKARESGEAMIEVKNIEIARFGRKSFVFEAGREDIEMAEKAMEFARKSIKKKPFMLILDEINVAVDKNLVKVEDVINLIRERGETNIILTGRNARKEIIEIADIVTEMRNIKHYYEKTGETIEGIDY
ncbi:MAG: cob(I)yrinic acid a,c-diamide adenosyltransferase [Thermoplasmatales archaeon]|nr:cob(I)yrinic acid a,c-diamide adenosyltransferase [Thermoplasmatales archaeon]